MIIYAFCSQKIKTTTSGGKVKCTGLTGSRPEVDFKIANAYLQPLLPSQSYYHDSRRRKQNPL